MKKKITPKSTPTKPVPTERYYFAMRGGVFFGNGESYMPFIGMPRHRYEEIEAEAERLNKTAGLVQPVDDDYCLGEEE